MSAPDTTNPPPRRRWLRDGGWIMLAAMSVTAVGMLYQVWINVGPQHPKRIGNGVTVESYGFDMSNLAVKPELVVASGMSKDMLRPLTDPEVLTAQQLDALNAKGHSKLVVPTDRVVGVIVSGKPRAYPISILNWHEVINDTLGDKQIAVTYSGLCDSVVVVSRELVGGTFGVSGLLYNSNTLLYDMGVEPGSESLWCQLSGRAISGPLAGQQLEILPAQVLQWRDWLALHPDTTIIRGDPDMAEQYKSDVYGPYYQTDELRFPVNPSIPHLEISVGGIELKSRCLALMLDGQQSALPYKDVIDNATFDSDGLGVCEIDLYGRKWRLHCRKQDVGFTPETVWLDDPDSQTSPCVMAFAWNAILGQDPNAASSVPAR